MEPQCRSAGAPRLNAALGAGRLLVNTPRDPYPITAGSPSQAVPQKRMRRIADEEWPERACVSSSIPVC